MNPCERCGATNQPASRFCVACGAPLVARPAAPTAPAARPGTGPSAPQSPPIPPYTAPAPQAPAGPPYASPYPVSQSPNTAWPQQSGPYPPGTAPPPPPNQPQYPHAVIQPYEGPASASLPFAETATPGTRGRASGPISPFAPGAVATAAMPGVEQDPTEIPEGAPKILAGFLITYESDPLGAFWAIHQGRNMVGREGAAPGLDISINHPTTSSRHAVFYAAARPGRIQIEDLGSTNGTFVNDSRLSTGQRVELRDGDRIRFGLFSALVKIV